MSVANTFTHSKRNMKPTEVRTVFQLPKYRVVETIKELTPTNTSTTKVEGEILFVISTKPSLNSTEIC